MVEKCTRMKIYRHECFFSELLWIFNTHLLDLSYEISSKSSEYSVLFFQSVFSDVNFLSLTCHVHNLKDCFKESNPIKWVNWGCLKIAPERVPFAQIFTFALGAAPGFSRMFPGRHYRKFVLLHFLLFGFEVFSEGWVGPKTKGK